KIWPRCVPGASLRATKSSIMRWRRGEPLLRVVIGSCSLSEVVDDLDLKAGLPTRHLNSSVSRLALPPLSSFPRTQAVAKRLRALAQVGRRRFILRRACPKPPNSAVEDVPRREARCGRFATHQARLLALASALLSGRLDVKIAPHTGRIDQR